MHPKRVVTLFCVRVGNMRGEISRENHYPLSETAFGKLHLAERTLGG